MDYILVSLLNVLAVPLFVRAVFNLEFCYKRIRVIGVGIIFGMSLVLALSVKGLDETWFQLFGILITTILLKEKKAKNLIVCVTSTLIYSLFVSIFRYIIPVHSLLFSNLLMVCFLLVLYTQKKIFVDVNYLSISQLVLFSFFILSIGSLISYSTEKILIERTNFYKIILLLILLMSILIFLFASFQWMLQKNFSEYRHRISIEILKKQKEYYTKQIESSKEIRKIKHDINNHFFVLHRYLEENKFDRANAYLEKLINEFKRVDRSKYTNNDLLNIILEDLNRDDKNQSIDVIFKGDFPVNLEIDEVDFCILFSNVLKNAFEANENIGASDKQVVLQSKTDDEKYWFAVSNPLNNEVVRAEDNRLLSTKDEKSRGIGTQSIQSVIRKYGGDVEFVVSDREFICRFIIPKKE